VFRQICFNRHFELEVAKAHRAGRIKVPIYLSVGQETIPVGIKKVIPSAAIFAQHRCHSWYLTYGGDPKKLRDELLGLETGCSNGMGGSASIHDPAIPMFGHSGLMGDQVPIAVGYALQTGKQTIVVMGDGAAEEDYVLGAMGFAATKKLPILFVVEDNDLAILTKKEVRRNWSIVDIAKGFGMYGTECTDHPTHIQLKTSVIKTIKTWPALINVKTCRHLWHAGSGNDGKPVENAYDFFKETEGNYHGVGEIQAIEDEVKKEVEELWQL